MSLKRSWEEERHTKETEVRIKLDVDGKGLCEINTGIGFFDHMLELMSSFAMFDAEITAKGDLDVDQHHTMEDVGLVYGIALRNAIGDKSGIKRFCSVEVPMDEALSAIAIDISGRPYLKYDVDIPVRLISEMDPVSLPEFLNAFINESKIAIHARLIYGSNPHHCLESVFKGIGIALKGALEIDPRRAGAVPSTKGTL